MLVVSHTSLSVSFTTIVTLSFPTPCSVLHHVCTKLLQNQMSVCIIMITIGSGCSFNCYDDGGKGGGTCTLTGLLQGRRRQEWERPVCCVCQGGHWDSAWSSSCSGEHSDQQRPVDQTQQWSDLQRNKIHLSLTNGRAGQGRAGRPG